MLSKCTAVVCEAEMGEKKNWPILGDISQQSLNFVGKKQRLKGRLL